MAFLVPAARAASRTLKGTLRPGEFPAFPGVSNLDELRAAWEWNHHWCLANFSHTTYQTRAVLEETLSRVGIRDFQIISHSGARALWLVVDDKRVLAFRGTRASRIRPVPDAVRSAAENFINAVIPGRVSLPAQYRQLLFNDILADINFVRVRLGDAQVHRGFLGELKKLWPQLQALNTERETAPNHESYCTGHSLGGALASLAAMRLPFDEVVTFGEPRVGVDIASEFKGGPDNHFRYVNGNDLVPELPPAWWPFSFEHHGVEEVIGDPGSREPLFDHSILDYADALC